MRMKSKFEIWIRSLLSKLVGGKYVCRCSICDSEIAMDNIDNHLKFHGYAVVKGKVVKVN